MDKATTKYKELYHLYGAMHVATDIKVPIFSYLGYVQRTNYNEMAKRIYENKPQGRRKDESPKSIWMDVHLRMSEDRRSLTAGCFLETKKSSGRSRRPDLGC